MGRSLFNSFGVMPQQQPVDPRISQLAAFAQQFRSNFNCTPQQKVQELLNTGQMTQEQFAQYKAIADQFLGRR